MIDVYACAPCPNNVAVNLSFCSKQYTVHVYSECQLRTKLHDKRDDFNFPIVNFPFICNHSPAAPADGVYISKLIRYSRACGSSHSFLDKVLLIKIKLLNQGFLVVKLKSHFESFRVRHYDMIDHLGMSVS